MPRLFFKSKEERLHKYCASGKAHKLKCVLRCGAGSAGPLDLQQPLRTSVSHGHTDCVEVLLSFGASVSDTDADERERGNLLLQVAARRGHADILQALISSGADVSAHVGDGWTALHEGCDAGRVQCVQELLEAGAHIDARDDHGRTPLHLAARGRHVDCLRLLLQRGADVRAVDKKKITALHYIAPSPFIHAPSSPAVVSDDSLVECTRLLANYGTDLDTVCVLDMTMLDKSAKCNRQELLRFLLEHGASVELDRRKCKKVDRAERKLRDGLSEMCNGIRGLGAFPCRTVAAPCTALQHCVHSSSPDGVGATLDLLLLHGASVSRRDRRGTRLMDIACDENMRQALTASMEKVKSRCDAVYHVLAQEMPPCLAGMVLKYTFREYALPWPPSLCCGS